MCFSDYICFRATTENLIGISNSLGERCVKQVAALAEQCSVLFRCFSLNWGIAGRMEKSFILASEKISDFFTVVCAITRMMTDECGRSVYAHRAKKYRNLFVV